MRRCCPWTRNVSQVLPAGRSSDIARRLRRARGLEPSLRQLDREIESAAAAFGATGSSVQLGQQLGRILLGVLGGATGQAAEQILADPEVQAELQRATEECKTRAKAGVGEYLEENWQTIAAIALALIGTGVGLNYLTTVAALLQVERSRGRAIAAAA